MLDLIVLNIFMRFNIWGQPHNDLVPLEVFPWHDTAIFELPAIKDDLVTKNIIQTYLNKIGERGINSNSQGIWIQSGWHTLASNQGTTPLPAASLTKIATTLAVLSEWGTKHQFATNVYITGEIESGTVTGDLIVEGNGDPLFVWEEAIALGNTLNQLGITSVAGDLLIGDRFYMNYQNQSQTAGKLLKQALNRKQWQGEITRQYLQMPVGTSQPEVAIASRVKSIDKIPDTATLLVTHRSLPVAEILRQMNIYSNNKMAQMLTDSLGGANQVAKISADLANFPPEEIELINGSGLGEENRISPRAVCQMLMAIDRLAFDSSLAATDLFPTAGRDTVGTVQNRSLPLGTTVKTGTLDNVSALAGIVSLNGQAIQKESPQNKVYFSIINYGRQYQYFRQQQDWLLDRLVREWDLIPPRNFSLAGKKSWFLGDPERNIVVR